MTEPTLDSLPSAQIEDDDPASDPAELVGEEVEDDLGDDLDVE